MKKRPVPERILETADRLFKRQGYGETGLNQLIEESQTAKASFYQYFPSKESLAEAYLERYYESQQYLLRGLMKKYPEPVDFLAAWTRLLYREARNGSLYGCPMANLRAQISFSSDSLHASVQRIARGSIALLADYLRDAKAAGRLPEHLDPTKCARRLFSAYEGVLQTWRLTDERTALEDLTVLAESVLER